MAKPEDASLLTRNPEAEAAALGGMLIDPQQLAPWLDLVVSEDWQEPMYALVWDTLHQLAIAGDPCDTVHVDAALSRTGRLRDVGQATIMGLANACPNSELTPHYVGIVVRNAVARAEYQIGDRLARRRITGAEARAQLEAQEDRLIALSERLGGRERGAYTAPELLALDVPPLRWVVPDLLPEGLTVLASKQKLGKSWLALALALAVASGGAWLGRRLEPGGALLLALEDSPRRLQSRMRQLLGPDPAPDGLSVQTSWPRLDIGGLRQLDRWLHSHPHTRVVILDVFARVRPPRNKYSDPYLEDYALMASLKALADRYHVALVIVHHTRKQAAEDVFDEVLGSVGIAGAADTLLVLARTRGEADGVLHVTGREIVEEGQFALRFDRVTGAWQMVGDAREVALSHERRAVLDALRLRAPKPMRERELATALGYAAGQDYTALRMRLARMVAGGEVQSPARGLYTVSEEMRVTSVTTLQMDWAEECNNVTDVTGMLNGHAGRCPRNPASGIHEYARQRDADGTRLCIHCEQPAAPDGSPPQSGASG